MNQRIKEKIEQYKKTAENGRHTPSRGNDTKHREGDGLAKVTRTKKDADQFMAELNGISKRAK
jgi:hypothetical protein